MEQTRCKRNIVEQNMIKMKDITIYTNRKTLSKMVQIQMLADQVPEEHGGAVHFQRGGSHQLHTMKVSSAWTLPNYFRFK